MKYEDRQLDDNHQIACAMRGDSGLIVQLLNWIYGLHNRVLAVSIRHRSIGRMGWFRCR